MGRKTVLYKKIRRAVGAQYDIQQINILADSVPKGRVFLVPLRVFYPYFAPMGREQ
jgi:hypothetical protein